MSPRALRLAALGLALLGLPREVVAQYDACHPGSGSNEAKTLALFSVPLSFSPAAAPGRPGGITFGIEAANVPSVDPTTATPTICRPGKGPENTDLLAGIARPRLGVPLPLGLALEASWIPPVRVNGVKANLIGLALARSVALTRTMTAGVRAHATLGEIHAPVTCDHQALGDPASECFHGHVSDDRLSPNIFGLDASLGWTMAAGRLRPYVGSGYSRLQPRFQVNFTNQFGSTDHTEVEVDLNRVALFGGAGWQVTPLLAVTGEIYAVPADAVTARLVIRQTLGI
ncbi:MAG: hypothetical protein ACJ8DJ_15675 [Gemmatimonadales bacterium]|jgi:hypothetical protein